MKDSWQAGDPYDYYMGRWSKLVAETFVEWVSPQAGLRWLDVGCGSGALSEAVIRQSKPAAVIAIDQSDGFVTTAQARLGPQATCKVGDALALPVEDASIDIAVSGLVLNFIPEPEKALAEMSRVTIPEGMVAVYIWDYAGTMAFLTYFWDVAVELDPNAAPLHEKYRFPQSNAEALSAAFVRVGLVEVETAPIEITTHFTDFDDYWNPFLGGQGPAPTYVLKLEDSERQKLKEALMQRLPMEEDGSIPLAARAWAVKGIVNGSQ
ncbi:MAG: class I SAM-dependent methyltransferase [Anaerolineae bacterium]|nr:class I SAM-dependent methyltransferase [Anaerolineae bacterium]MCB9106569.1 class I SAM-dependent methyltransferase [Anaerolineales bacterium]